MNAPVSQPSPGVRAEHPSIQAYLAESMPPEQLRRVLIVTFTQWDFALGALAEIAVALRTMGSDLSLAFWTDHTPLRDPGWSASGRLARAMGSASRDRHAIVALKATGVPEGSFVAPPIRRWKPTAPIPIDGPMNRTQIRALTYHGSPMGRAILQVHPDTETPITDTFFWSKRWLLAAARSYAFVFDQTLEAIRRGSITAVAVYNGRFLHDRAASAAAEFAGVPVLYYDTGGIDTDFDVTDAVTHDWTDLQRRMLAMYDAWPPDERDVIGCSWFDERRKHIAPNNSLFVENPRLGESVDLPQGKRVIAYFSSSGDEIAELEIDWGMFIGNQEAALQLLADECRRLPDTTLVVRSHPHMRMKPEQDLQEWMRAVDRAAPDIHLDPYSSVDSYALMTQADLVVTYGSTTGVEAAYAGKPVIVMGPSAYDQLGCARFVATQEELAAALVDTRPGSWSAAVSYGLMMRRRGFMLEFVRRDPVDGFSLADHSFDDAPIAVRHAGHLYKRFQKWRLSR